MRELRKPATIRKISAIEPIEGAHKIEVAIVDGWKGVVRKNKYQGEEPFMYCEADSLMPIRPEFEYLRKSGRTFAWDILAWTSKRRR